MCGGTLEIVPCSRVGHVFRSKTPYKWRSGVDVFRRNSVRLAEVWLDEYAQYFYERTGSKKGNFGNITERVKLRKDLGCKSFKWYVENIYPELSVPGNYIARGEVRFFFFLYSISSTLADTKNFHYRCAILGLEELNVLIHNPKKSLLHLFGAAITTVETNILSTTMGS